jgi:anti-anti-sigma factor
VIRDELRFRLRLTPSAALIDLDGDVTIFAEERLQEAYRQATQAGARRLVINFRHSDYINSAGLALLIGIAADTRQRGQQLAFCGLTPHFQKIFRMVGLGSYAVICADEREALAAFADTAADGT